MQLNEKIIFINDFIPGKYIRTGELLLTTQKTKVKGVFYVEYYSSGMMMMMRRH